MLARPVDEPRITRARRAHGLDAGARVFRGGRALPGSARRVRREKRLNPRES
ncbi:serine/threonine kinase family protein [Cystobacter fuscus DSM 2262]|uniref:Serine/threonine kinase family protein n=1 Tax=Cystobacter fuscus (strain ATCC 25194 / DSM 2262 / NBRC 100088 / M29) TaxID=1242864 RepID=S9PCA2_CYSF2|nr:serine/threonine kinase family protein [Cystobacter fuscus DSM 2262]